jgi:hypothetical protein
LTMISETAPFTEREYRYLVDRVVRQGVMQIGQRAPYALKSGYACPDCGGHKHRLFERCVDCEDTRVMQIQLSPGYEGARELYNAVIEGREARLIQ